VESDADTDVSDKHVLISHEEDEKEHSDPNGAEDEDEDEADASLAHEEEELDHSDSDDSDSEDKDVEECDEGRQVDILSLLFLYVMFVLCLD
jgi:hypothetical protein